MLIIIIIIIIIHTVFQDLPEDGQEIAELVKTTCMMISQMMSSKYNKGMKQFCSLRHTNGSYEIIQHIYI